MKSCEIDYDNHTSFTLSVNGVPLGTQDNLFCITGEAQERAITSAILSQEL